MASSKIKEKYNNFDWKEAFELYKKPHVGKSLWQVANTIGMYLLLWYLMYRTLDVSYLLTLLLSVFVAGMIIRLFVIFHDCVHGSYFRSRKANNMLGRILSLFVFTPFDFWRRDHLSHHASVCNLDHKGKGDVWTLSVKDYNNLSGWQRFKYRFSRHPLAILFMAPIFLRNRIPPKTASSKDKMSIVLTNLAVVLIVVFISLLVGLKNFLLIQIPIFFFASAIGSWLFYIQHQFTGAQWKRSDKWDHLTAALEGTSFYDLPPFLHWFTGNISFHHIHHLCPQIPNYNLPKCHRHYKPLQKVSTISLGSSLKMCNNHLWDEEKEIFVRFK